MTQILVVNAGSTSLKLRLVAEDDASVEIGSVEEAVGRVAAVAHRVVHGGARFREAVVVDADVLSEIRELERIAPLHNAPALDGIEAARDVLPDVPHVAVFDTGFHATIPAEAATYAVPARWREEWGVRRYGFHGLSVAWSAEQAPRLLGREPEGLRLVVCHLGGGCSVTAVRDGRSVDTTMGFSPLEGPPMTTRSGSVDPGALVYVLREHGLGAAELDHELNLESGLRGLAGGSGEMLELERRVAAGDGVAAAALDVFVYRLAAAVAAMAAGAGGLDALVFTGGIGEGSALVRARVCARLGFLGVELDGSLNSALSESDVGISAATSAVRVLVVLAREEVVAARAVRRVLAAARSEEGGAVGSV